MHCLVAPSQLNIGAGVGAGVGGGWHVAEPGSEVQPGSQSTHWLLLPRPYMFAPHISQVLVGSMADVAVEALPGRHVMAVHAMLSPRVKLPGPQPTHLH